LGENFRTIAHYKNHVLTGLYKIYCAIVLLSKNAKALLGGACAKDKIQILALDNPKSHRIKKLGKVYPSYK